MDSTLNPMGIVLLFILIPLFVLSSSYFFTQCNLISRKLNTKQYDALVKAQGYIPDSYDLFREITITERIENICIFLFNSVPESLMKFD